MKKNVAIAVVAILSFTATNAQNDVNDQLNPLLTGIPFLTITPDARAGGMGDLGVATTPDAASQYWNPAKYAFMESEVGLTFAYTPWLSQLVSDINLSNLAAYWRFEERQTLSASLRFFSLGEVNLTDHDGKPLSDVHPNDFAIDAAYTLLLSEKLSGSVALRFVRSNLGNIPGSGDDMEPGLSFGADVAAYYRTPITLASGDANLAFGLNISNIGTKVSYDGGQTNNFIPTNLRLGTSFDYPIDSYNKISFSADLNKLLVPSAPRYIGYDGGSANPDFQAALKDYYNTTPIAGIFKSFGDAPRGFREELEEVMWSLGAEYAYNNQFFVRGGYFHESQNKGNRKFFTAGVGFKLNVFQLDAGYVISVAQTNPLDGTLRLGLSFDLFGLKNLVN
ncbi:MAG: type IX secretion system outer membrane channel protein PorV [Prevotellaceae bacterium]|jgi:hypothetical protein|nr:type IX secretion system outer membrane channel protein PorV [Prevotellaceae bacterium]